MWMPIISLIYPQFTPRHLPSSATSLLVLAFTKPSNYNSYWLFHSWTHLQNICITRIE